MRQRLRQEAEGKRGCERVGLRAIHKLVKISLITCWACNIILPVLRGEGNQGNGYNGTARGVQRKCVLGREKGG